MRKPKDKGAVENGVQNVERWIIAPLRNRQFFSFHEVQIAIREQLEMLKQIKLLLVKLDVIVILVYDHKAVVQQ